LGGGHLVGLILMLAGGLTLVGGIVSGIRTRSFLRRAVTVEGTVIRNEKKHSSSSSDTGVARAFRRLEIQVWGAERLNT
jgi:hypothetical protein